MTDVIKGRAAGGGHRWWSLAGATLMAAGLPFILGRVPPNGWSGLRVPATLTDERVWYAANRVMGYDLLLAGAAVFVSALATAGLARREPALARRINLVVLAVALAAAAAHSLWALSRL